MGDSLNENEIEEIEQIFVSADVNNVSVSSNQMQFLVINLTSNLISNRTVR